jgi:hypothetical protein
VFVGLRAAGVGEGVAVPGRGGSDGRVSATRVAAGIGGGVRGAHATNGASASMGTLRALTWNVAAINNNPFGQY